MNTISVTYSPDDNKLRLEAAHDLDDATLQRVKAAGFSWAPKQQRFVAPCWTPEREDLALELAGEIDDEDSSLLDRAEDRASRFSLYSQRRHREAEAATKAVSAIADNIPLGQPILVGHHSERHARRDAQRIENGMRRAVSLWKTSEYWQMRAQAALSHARYKERPDVRHRRIKTLEADRRRWERQKAECEGWLNLWNRIDDPDSIKRRDGTATSKPERALWVANQCHLQVAAETPEGDLRNGFWTAWDVLQPDEKRSSRCPSMTPEEVQEVARRVYPARIATCERWIAHLDNRLTYERAMLEEQGGYQEPKKKTTADLPLLNYGGPVAWRNRYTGAVISGETVGLTKAQWAAINPDYKGTVESACGTHRLRNTNMAPGHRQQLVVVCLTDSKQHPRPTQDQIDAAADAQARTAQERLAEKARRAGQAGSAAQTGPQRQSRASFEALAQQVEAGVQVVAAPQLFPTPQALAERMVKLADLRTGQRVLEPSSGSGNLMRAVYTVADVELVGVEISPRLVEATRGNGVLCLANLRCADFLSLSADDLGGLFDRIVMNPPFSNGADILHIRHAAGMLVPGGLLVALCANGPRQREALREKAEFWEDLPAGSFKEAGTGVNVALLVIRRAQ